MSKHYTTKEIREFIKCPQFGDTEYGKWGSLKLEVREALLEQVNLIESMDYIIQQKENIIKEVREWAKKYSCQFTNDDGELVVSEISFNIQARPCDLFKILDKGE